MSYYRYGRYVNSDQETRWATVSEIKKSGKKIDLEADAYPAGGIPLLYENGYLWVDDQDTHTLIFGATGSKKTRLFCMPLLNILAKAGESFICSDPKGELYNKTSGLVRSMGYKTVVLNFRQIGHGDMWNPLFIPRNLYHSGYTEKATSMLSDFIAALAAPMMESSKGDPFWPQMASAYAMSNLMLLMECATAEEANVTSLARLCDVSSVNGLKALVKNMAKNSIVRLNYSNTLDAPDRTQSSILATLYSMVRPFVTQKDLCGMLSGNTIDLSTIGQQKTAVYIIIPDEKSTNHFLVTTFIKQAYQVLIEEAQKRSDNTLPVRVNFVLDEFCNIPTVPDMPAMISAARSRNMRFFLVAQSLHQLRGKYKEDADTIKGNCDNWVFLTSKEYELLKEISDLCGSIHLDDRSTRPLISVSELQRLDKKKGEALILHSRQYPVITEIPDIDSYKMFSGYDPIPLNTFDVPEVSLFDLDKLIDDVMSDRRPIPFSD